MEFLFNYDLIPVDDEEEYRRRVFYEYPYFNEFEYDVYNVLFNSKELEGIIPKDINLGQTTINKKLQMDLAKQLGRAVIEDFNIKNEKKYLLDEYWLSRILKKILDKRVTIRLVDKDTVGSIGEVIYISRVGFNMNKTKALVYVKKVNVKMTEAEYLIVLERKDWNQKWRITAKLDLAPL
jgi:hypothetical protein